MGEARLDRLKDYRASDDDGGLADDDPPFFKVNRGTMTIDKISELVSRYRLLLNMST